MSTAIIAAGLTAVGTKQLFVEATGPGPTWYWSTAWAAPRTSTNPSRLAGRTFRVIRSDFSGHGRSPGPGN